MAEVVGITQVESQLAEQISALSPGDRIEGERELVERFGVSRAVVRSALDALERRFIIHRVPGAGTFVADRFDLTVSNREAPSLHATAAATGHEVRTRLVSSGRAPLPERHARLLGVAPGTETLTLQRVGAIDGTPATWGREWVVPGRARDLDAALGVIESVYDALTAFGFEPMRGRSIASVEDVPPEIRVALGFRKPALAWRMITANVDRRTKEPLLVSDSWLRMDAVRLVFDFQSD